MSKFPQEPPPLVTSVFDWLSSLNGCSGSECYNVDVYISPHKAIAEPSLSCIHSYVTDGTLLLTTYLAKLEGLAMPKSHNISFFPRCMPTQVLWVIASDTTVLFLRNKTSALHLTTPQAADQRKASNL